MIIGLILDLLVVQPNNNCADRKRVGAQQPINPAVATLAAPGHKLAKATSTLIAPGLVSL
jgi:hypothetical protein